MIKVAETMKMIGDSSQLQNGVGSVTFMVKKNGEKLPAFVIRYQDQVHAYLNICGHLPMPLDLADGRFFTDDGERLMCTRHGAEYAPADGSCVSGPCFGIGLEKLDINEINGKVYLNSEDCEVIG